MNNTITVAQAHNTIDIAINNFNGTVDAATAETIAYAINRDIQLRDYVMGLPIIHGVTKTASFISALIQSVEESEAYSLYTILGMLEYEMGSKETAKVIFNKVDNLKPNYNLNRLLKMVYLAEWPTTAFGQMREEMHHKVVELITSEYSQSEITKVKY